MTRIVKREDGYWIIDLPMNTPDCGPYAKLYGDCPDDCAAEALKGLEHFFLYVYDYSSDVRVKVKKKRLT